VWDDSAVRGLYCDLASARSTLPVEVDRLDIAQQVEKVEGLALGGAAQCGPGSDVGGSRELFAVLDPGHYGLVPPGPVGEVRAGHARGGAQSPQAWGQAYVTCFLLRQRVVATTATRTRAIAPTFRTANALNPASLRRYRLRSRCAA
jgi:hypothetical protein